MDPADRSSYSPDGQAGTDCQAFDRDHASLLEENRDQAKNKKQVKTGYAPIGSTMLVPIWPYIYHACIGWKLLMWHSVRLRLHGGHWSIWAHVRARMLRSRRTHLRRISICHRAHSRSWSKLKIKISKKFQNLDPFRVFNPFPSRPVQNELNRTSTRSGSNGQIYFSPKNTTGRVKNN